MEFVPLLALAALVKKTLDWARVLIPDHLEAKVLIPISMAVGVAYALLFSASDALADGITIWGDNTLGSADVALVVVYGLTVGSVGGVIHDWVKPSTPPHDGR